MSLILHLAALGLAGLAVWIAYGPKGDGPQSDSLWFDLKREQVTRLELLRPERQVSITQAAQSGFRIKIREELPPAAKKIDDQKTDAKKADPKKDGDKKIAAKKADGDAEQKPITRESSYRASAELGKALDRVLPLVAVRDLGVMDAQSLSRFGLADSEVSLSIASAEQEFRFEVGKKTYGGSSFYLRRLPRGEVALVSSGLLRTVDIKPPRFKELRFLGVPAKEVERIDLVCAELGKRSLIRKPGQKAGSYRWEPLDDPGRDDVLFSGFANKLLRLGVTEYLPQAPDLVSKARCELSCLGNDEPVRASLVFAGQGKFLGQSEFSGGWVTLEPSSAAAIEADLNAVLGVETPAGP